MTGTDISGEMISVAGEICNDNNMHFFICGAENVPIPENPYDIVTAAGMVQWVDVKKFLKCMDKIMCMNGILLIYDFGITDQKTDDCGYHDWWHNQYLVKFPRPYRNETVWKQEDVNEYGFQIRKQVTYEMKYEFQLDEFIRFMMIQSNVNTKIETGRITIEEASQWFYSTLQPIFMQEKRTLIFNGYSWYIERG